MHCLIPGLIAESPLRDLALDRVRLPWLERSFARGARGEIEPVGLDGALCTLLGIARQVDWPLAPITLLAEGIDPGAHHWLRADPVHLSLRREQVVVEPVDEISAEQAAALVEALNAHFTGQAVFLAPHSARWYARLSTPPRARTTPLAQVFGRDLSNHQPGMQAGRPLRALMSEAQILLHNHPLNAEREARGLRAINGIWCWGGGTLPARPAPPDLRLHACGHEAQAVGRFAHGAAAREPCSDSLHQGMATFGRATGNADVLVVTDIAEAEVSGDPDRYRDALVRLDASLIATLWKTRPSFVLEDPHAGARLTVTRWHRLRIWRRRAPLATPTPLDVRMPEPMAEVDEFGNRIHA